MPTGVIINALSIVFGGILGGLVGHKLIEDFKIQINLVFGICSMGMGIASIGGMKFMPAVIFALVIGTGLGLACNLGNWINRVGLLMEKGMTKLLPSQSTTLSHDEFLANLLTVIVLFCASGTGIYGSLDAGMSGDSTILISKSILDFFTAAIFACNLGYVVSAVAIPQFIFFTALFYLAHLILPLTTPDMIADFKACGGFLMLATGFRMIRVKMFPVADMIPAMLLVMPLSWIWANFILPLL
ncbi:DUF554 domain-containing protein [Streptococcus gallolyticus]|uniref:DUF554 domain-containing protein n=1 Tax=Streptococcus hepaticus TaxID=3349163 RepID=UPI001C94B637|nr:DUF554 domain-containing protein [Streptococcus gallolyticus]MBY5041311.1 DUF554 domain-containing protein [Streptococcus gallolyticus]